MNALRRLPVLGPSVLLLTLAGSIQAQRSARLPAVFPDGRQGVEALERLGERLGDVARANGTTAAELRQRLLSDESLWVDGEGRLFFVDAPPAGEVSEPVEVEEPGSPGGPGAIDGIDSTNAFMQHSRPGADRVIYLDFDGHWSKNNSWGHNIQFPAYDVNGDPSTFSTGELNNIIAQWKHVAEDFAPFEVDVTTEEPPLDWLMKTGPGDDNWGVRCVFTQATQGFGNGIGGVAFLNSFDDSIDNPVFAFNKKNNNGGMTGSHEVGHALGLSHDGLNSSTYHPGSGQGQSSWGPIMGAPFYKKLVQWSNGDYAGATNTENDINVITRTQNGVTVKVDDHPDVLGTGAYLDVNCPVPTSVQIAGVIERRNDRDVFEFDSLGGTYTILADHAPVGRNLDILLEVYDGLGNLVAADDPLTVPNASLTLSLVPGPYTIAIDGTDQPGRYSDYGSLGVYTITLMPVGGFFDLGNGLPGTKTPTLSGTGFGCTGQTVSLDLKRGLPSTLTLLAYGTSASNMPYKGGVLVPNIGPGGGVLTLSSDATGKLSVARPWPAGIPSGTTFYFQYWQPDAFGPQGWTATNALRITAP